MERIIVRKEAVYNLYQDKKKILIKNINNLYINALIYKLFIYINQHLIK